MKCPVHPGTTYTKLAVIALIMAVPLMIPTNVPAAKMSNVRLFMRDA